MPTQPQKTSGHAVGQIRRKVPRAKHEKKEEKDSKTATITDRGQPGNGIQNPTIYHSEDSQYQSTSAHELPSATSWPDITTIPCQTQIEYDLIGLTSYLPSNQGLPYDETTHHQYMNCPYPGPVQIHYPTTTTSVGYGSTVMSQWITEPPPQQGALLAWEEYGELMTDRKDV